MAFTTYIDTGKSFSVKNFRNQFKDGIAKPSLFHFKLNRYPNCFYNTTSSVTSFLNKYDIGVPSLSLNKTINTIENVYENLNSRGLSDLVFKVYSTTLPTKLITTYSSKIYGPSTTFPREIENGTFQISLYASGNYWEHDFFSQWQSAITGYGNSSADPTHNVSYYDDIISEAKIIAYNEEAEPSYLVSLEEVWPINVEGINYNWGEKNEIVKFSVQMHYKLSNVEKIAFSTKIQSNVIDKIRSLI